MRRVTSILLTIAIIFSSTGFGYSNEVAAAASYINISMSQGGTDANPTVILTVDTGGKGIAGVTYERGYNKTADANSPRLYGVVPDIPFTMEDVNRYVNVYVQLEDGTSATESFELTGKRVYNSGGGSFSIYPKTPLTDSASTDLIVDVVDGNVGGGDNGPLAVVDDEVWVFTTNSQVVRIFKTSDLEQYFGTSKTIPRTEFSIPGKNFTEYANSIIYDGRYVMAVDSSLNLVIIEKNGNSKAVIDAQTLIENYNYTDIKGKISAITSDGKNLYLLTNQGKLFKAEKNSDGSYTINTTTLLSLTSSQYSSGNYLDMAFDGTNIWIPGNCASVTKYNTQTESADFITTNGYVSKVIFDGKEHVYLTGAREIPGTPPRYIEKLDISSTGTPEKVFTDMGAGGYQEDMSFDGRNIWIHSYGVNYNNERYDTVANSKVTIPTSTWEANGGVRLSNVIGVYDGKYQWFWNYANKDITVVGRTKKISYGSLEKYFSESPVLPSDTIVFADDRPSTNPEYVDIKTSAGESLSEIVHVAWTFDETETGANSKDAAFFQNMNNYADDSTFRKNSWREYASKTGKYFEINSEDPYFPARDSGTGDFTFSMPTFPKTNGYYTVYMRAADGSEVIDKIYIDNYKAVGIVNIYIQEVDASGTLIEPVNYIYKDVDATNMVGSTATISVAEQIPYLEEMGYILFGSSTRTVEVTAESEVSFWAKRDLRKWSNIVMKPYYMNEANEKVYIPITSPERLQLVGTTVKVEAPHLELYKIKNLAEGTKTVTIVNGGTSDAEYGTTEVEFEYVPVNTSLLNKGIEVDSEGIPTGTIVYSDRVDGDEGSTKGIAAKMLDNWELDGLVNYDAFGNFSGIETNVAMKLATFGTDKEVVFAYTHKTVDIKVNYVRKDDKDVVLASDIYTVKVDSDLTLVAKDIAGFRLDDPSSNKIKITASQENSLITYTFEYVPNGLIVGIKGVEVDSGGNLTGNVVYSQQVEGGETDKKTVPAKNDFVNWKLVGLVNYNEDGTFKNISEGTMEKEITFGTDKEIVFAYERIMTKVIVKYIEDGTNVEVGTADTYTVPLNTQFIATAKAVDGYKLKDSSAYQTALTADGEIVHSFTYVKLGATVKLRALLENSDGKVLAQASKDAPLGSTNVFVSANELSAMLSPRYVLDTTQSTNPATLALVGENSVVDFIFKEQKTAVQVNYVDGSGNSIAESKTYEVPYGQTIRENAISVANYFVSTGCEPSFTKVAAQGIENITFRYTKSNGAITIIAKDGDTGEILSYKTYEGEQGKTLTIDSESEFIGEEFLDYYVLDVSSDGTQSAVYDAFHKEIIFIYDKQSYTLTINAVDDAGNSINFFDGTTSKVFTFNIGEAYSVYAPPVSGYSIKAGTSNHTNNNGITKDETFTFEYEPIVKTVNVIVKAISEDGSVLIGSSVIQGDRGKSATIKAEDYIGTLYDPDKWDLVDDAEKTIQYGLDYEVKFKFKRKQVKLTVNYYDDSNDKVLLSEVFDVDTMSSEVVAMKGFSNYRLAEGQNASEHVDIGTTDSTVTIHYVAVTGNIGVIAIDADTGDILEVKAYSGNVGESFTLTEAMLGTFETYVHAGYIYDDESVLTLDSIDEDPSKNIMKLKFNKKMANITVKYLDKNGNSVLPDSEYQAQYGTMLKEYALNVNLYNLTSESYVEYKNVDKDYEIIFKYEQIIIPDGVINLIAQTVDGKTLAVKSVTGVIGVEEIFDANTVFGTITGYQLSGTGQASGVYENGFVNIIFIYKKVDMRIDVIAKNGTTGAVITSEVLYVQEGADTVVYAPHIEGYQVLGEQSVALKNVTKAQTITFNYVALNNIVIHKGIEVGEDDKPTGNTVYVKKAYGNNLTTFTVDAEMALENWDIVGLVNYDTDGKFVDISSGITSKEVTYGTDLEVVFAYKRKMIDFTAKYVEDGTGVLLGQDIYKIPLNTEITVNGKAIEGYKLKDSGAYSATILATQGTTETTFVYEKLSEAVVKVARLNDAEGKILAQSSVNHPLGSTNVEINADDLEKMLKPRYLLDADKTPSPYILAEVKDGSVITFIFKEQRSNVTVRYLDEDGNEVATAKTYSVAYGEAIRETALSIKDYYLDMTTSSPNVTFDAANKETYNIDFTYKKSNGSVSVIAKDKASGEILYYKVYAGERGESLSIDSATEFAAAEFLSYYKLDTDLSTAAQTMEYQDAHQEMIFLYSKETFDVTITGKDANTGERITFFDGATSKTLTYNKGDKYSIYAPPVAGYIIKEGTANVTENATGITGNKTFEFVYEKINSNTNITVKAVSDDGTVIIGVQVISGTMNESVTVDIADYASLYDPAKWTLVGEDKKTVTYGVDKEVIFTFNGEKVNVTIKAVDQSTGMALPFSEPSSISVSIGGSLAVYAPHIRDYVVEGQSYVNLNNISKAETVTFIYKKIAVPDRIIEKHISYVNESQVLIKSIIHDGSIGSVVVANPLPNAEELGYKININSDMEKTAIHGNEKEIVFLYDRIMNELKIDYNVDIYDTHEDFQAGNASGQLTEADKADKAPLLVNKTVRVEKDGYYTVTAPFENDYIINIVKNTTPLRDSIEMNANRTVDYYYRNITGNVLVRAVVLDDNGKIVLNGKKYKLLAQLDDNCSVGEVYTNAEGIRSDLENLLSPGYVYKTSGGLLEGAESFTPMAGDTYKDNILTYEFIGDYKEVIVSYFGANETLLPAKILGLSSNPEKVRVLNGDYISKYALNVNDYNFTMSSLNGSPSTESYHNVQVVENGTLVFRYEPMELLQEVTLNLMSGGVTLGTETISVMSGQRIYAPYVDGYTPDKKYVDLGADIDSSYVFTYTKIVTSSGGDSKTIYVEDSTYKLPFQHNAFITGYEDGTMGAERSITRGEVSMMLYNILHDASTDSKGYPTTSSLTDVKQTAWYAKAVNYMQAQGYIYGYEDGTFKPENEITREEFTAVLSRIFGKGKSADITGLPVGLSTWSTEAVIDAYASGFFKDIDLKQYEWRGAIKRAEVIVMINNAIKRVPNKAYLDTLKAPSDLQKNHWAYYHILEALNNHSGFYKDHFGEEQEIIK